ncbi:MAG: hypothetical protein JW800_00885 [Candidatus Omnitrophica bacterium]|nr:hypothetical protein [Candidatus Omnitrophota bacterium]
MFRRRRYIEGFTLTEILIVSIMVLLVVAVAMSTYVLLSQYVSDLAKQAILQGKTRLCAERIVRDAREAASISCTLSGNEINFTYDPQRIGKAGSNWTSRYRLSGGKILFTADTSVGVETVVVENVSLDTGDKLFQYDLGTKLVTIDLQVEKIGTANEQDADISTIVKARNAY